MKILKYNIKAVKSGDGCKGCKFDNNDDRVTCYNIRRLIKKDRMNIKHCTENPGYIYLDLIPGAKDE